MSDEVRHLDRAAAEGLRHTLTTARSVRELFSYKFPASGLGGVNGMASVANEAAIHQARLLGELAQLNSEALEAAITKRVHVRVGFDEKVVRKASDYQMSDGHVIVDMEDLYRLNQLMRRMDSPMNIWEQTREGMIEDFFGSWAAGEESDGDAFDSDNAWGLVFPFQ